MKLTRIGNFIEKKDLTKLKYPHTTIMFTCRACCFKNLTTVLYSICIKLVLKGRFYRHMYKIKLF